MATCWPAPRAHAGVGEAGRGCRVLSRSVYAVLRLWGSGQAELSWRSSVDAAGAEKAVHAAVGVRHAIRHASKLRQE